MVRMKAANLPAAAGSDKSVACVNSTGPKKTFLAALDLFADARHNIARYTKAAREKFGGPRVTYGELNHVSRRRAKPATFSDLSRSQRPRDQLASVLRWMIWSGRFAVCTAERPLAT